MIMDVKAKANSTEYVRSLLFTKKEIGILKLVEMLPFINVSSKGNQRLKAIYMKIFPVFFSYAELSKTYIQECLNLIAKIKRHQFFAREKSLFDGWQVRLKTLLPNYSENPKELKDLRENENRFMNIPGTDRYDIIGYAELDLFYRFHKWLKYHKLHKYLYFFSNLSFSEIESINADNISKYEDKVDLAPMTIGARNAILRKLAELKARAQRIETFTQRDYYINVSKIEKSIDEIKAILKTPIRKNHVYCENNLPSLLNDAIETVIFAVLRSPKDETIKVFDASLSLLKMAWGCNFFEPDSKNNFNALQTALNSKMKSLNKKRKPAVVQRDVNNNIYIDNHDIYLGNHDIYFNNHDIYLNNHDIYTVHFDIESGIRSITYFLENFVLQEM